MRPVEATMPYSDVTTKGSLFSLSWWGVGWFAWRLAGRNSASHQQTQSPIYKIECDRKIIKRKRHCLNKFSPPKRCPFRSNHPLRQLSRKEHCAGLSHRVCIVIRGCITFFIGAYLFALPARCFPTTRPKLRWLPLKKFLLTRRSWWCLITNLSLSSEMQTVAQPYLTAGFCWRSDRA